MSKIRIIEIWWDGPYSVEEVQNNYKDESKHYGLYQIYGTHAISGPNTLLYIGKANAQTFSTRISQHYWTAVEPSSIQGYIGLFGSTKSIPHTDWEKQIDDAERLLIYYCTPPYNASGIIKYGNITDTIVLNFDKKNRLPYEVSTYYDDSDWWKEDDKWKPYSMK